MIAGVALLKKLVNHSSIYVRMITKYGNTTHILYVRRCGIMSMKLLISKLPRDSRKSNRVFREIKQ